MINNDYKKEIKISDVINQKENNNNKKTCVKKIGFLYKLNHD